MIKPTSYIYYWVSNPILKGDGGDSNRRDVREVLCHAPYTQLDNNVHSNHYASRILANPSQFKEPNPNLNHRVVYLERTQAAGTLHLPEQDIYQPLSSEVGAETQRLPVPLVGDSRQGGCWKLP